MFLVDTDIIIWLLRGNQNVLIRTRQIIENHVVYLSTITVAEVYQHIFPKEIVNAEELFSNYTILPVTIEVAKRGGLYWQNYQKNLKALSLPDCLIAATAFESKLTILTLNTRHFPMTDIKVLHPLKNR